MSFRWVYQDTSGVQTGASEVFDTQQEAEDWLGVEWRRLRDDGVLSVRLTDGEKRVYEMKLTEE